MECNVLTYIEWLALWPDIPSFIKNYEGLQWFKLLLNMGNIMVSKAHRAAIFTDLQVHGGGGVGRRLKIKSTNKVSENTMCQEERWGWFILDYQENLWEKAAFDLRPNWWEYVKKADRHKAENEHFRWYEHVPRPWGKDKYDVLEEVKECWYGWNRKREEKSDKLKQVDQDMGFYSLFSATESRHRVKATFPLPCYALSC